MDVLPPCPCGRRVLLAGLAAALLPSAGALAAVDDDAPRAGDWLVPVEPSGVVAGEPLDPAALPDRPRLALPFDAQQGRVRADTPLNRIVLIRLDPAAMDEATRARAADGVLAYSASCTHGACSVHEWRPRTRTLLCPCHFSQFEPLRGGAVHSGPAPRALPALPLRTEAGRLVIAGGFSERPGPV